jgi:hypothetical protein
MPNKETAYPERNAVFYSRSQRLDSACAYLYRVKQVPEVVRRNPV